jgi:hypothetical protein
MRDPEQQIESWALPGVSLLRNAEGSGHEYRIKSNIKVLAVFCQNAQHNK